VAFLADRDSVFDAFVGRVGSGEWTNLTRGSLPQLFNEDVRNIGFADDSDDVWIRVADILSPATVRIAPRTGGPTRLFLPTAVMAAWSPDGSRLAYHETTPGDPIYVAERDGARPRRLFIGEAGTHAHHLSWSADGRFLYFTRGVPPDQMDVWRLPVTGGAPERITRHDSRVAHPVAIDDRSLLYTATADDGSGPWLYAMDLPTRVAVRLSTGVEHYLSIAASAAAPGASRRLVATVSNPNVALWTVPIGSEVAEESASRPMALPTARSAAPRFGGDGSLLYLASLGGGDGVWQSNGRQAREIWRARDGAVVGGVAVSPDGGRMCFPVRRQERTTLHCGSIDGKNVSVLAESLDVRGTPSWSPDGGWIAIGARVGGVVTAFKVPLGGGPAVRLVDSASSNPVWSPDGSFILYSGAPRARSVPVRAVRPDGTPYTIPSLVVDRVGDSYRFLADGRRLVVKLGGFRRQDFWLFDLATGERRRITRLKPGDSLRRFDVSHDGTRLVFERVRENSDVVLIELPPR
jgi:Tol biopolymer transport system component